MKKFYNFFKNFILESVNPTNRPISALEVVLLFRPNTERNLNCILNFRDEQKSNYKL